MPCQMSPVPWVPPLPLEQWLAVRDFPSALTPHFALKFGFHLHITALYYSLSCTHDCTVYHSLSLNTYTL